MSKRRIAREIAFKCLFAIDINELDVDTQLNYIILDYGKIDKENEKFIKDIVKGVLQNKEEIDEKIKELSVGWKIDRIAKVDKNILRIAIYEILHRKDIPVSVSINEAVELAKKFSTDDSSKFVNGILGTLVKNQDTPAQDQDVEVISCQE